MNASSSHLPHKRGEQQYAAPCQFWQHLKTPGALDTLWIFLSRYHEQDIDTFKASQPLLSISIHYLRISQTRKLLMLLGFFARWTEAIPSTRSAARNLISCYTCYSNHNCYFLSLDVILSLAFRFEIIRSG